MKKSILLVFLFTLVLSCENESCDTVSCVGPATLAFEILQDGQNIFDNETSVDDITLSGNFPETFELRVEESNYNGGTQLLFVEQIQWEVGNYNFQIVANAAQSEALSVNIELSEGDCCAGIARISSFRVNTTVLENPNQVVTLNLE